MATVYETLCQKYHDERELFFNVKMDCAIFVETLISNLSQYIGLTKDRIELYPVNSEIGSDEAGKINYTAYGAIDLKEDTFWHFRICVTVEESPNIWPKARVVVNVKVKITEKGYIVSVEGGGKSFEKYPRPLPNPVNLNRLCNRIVRVMDHILGNTMRFLEKGKEEYESVTNK